MNLAPLPDALNAELFAAVAALITTLCAAFAGPLASIPGFRPSDSTRSTLMRVLVYVLSLAAVVGYTFIQGVVITKPEVLTLLVSLAGGTGFAHVVYATVGSGKAAVAAKSVAAAAASGVSGRVDPAALAAVQQATGAAAS